MTGSSEISFVAAGNEGGGAALDQVIGMTVVGAWSSARCCAGSATCTGTRKITWVNSVAEWAGRKFKRPPWVAVPIALFIATLICALFGFIWDVSLHIGKGRDPGPLANPAHYFILFGLFLLFVAGCAGDRAALRQARPVRGPDHPRLVRARRRHADGRLRAVRADRLPARRHLAPHLRPGRHAVGPDAPDDDRRRRVLDDLRAAPRVRGSAGDGRRRAQGRHLSSSSSSTSASAASSSVCRCSRSSSTSASPQFRQVFEPMLIAAAAAFGLVAARMMLGRGAAIIAALFAIVLRGARRADRRPGTRRADQLVRAVPRSGASSSNCSRSTPLFKRPIVFGAVSGLRRQHRRAVAGVAVDRRGLPLPVADEHVAGGAGDGRAGRGPHRRLRRDARHGAHRPAAAAPRDRHRTGRRSPSWSSAGRSPTDCATRCRRTPPPQ